MTHLFKLWIRFLNQLQSSILLLLRFSVGLIFIQTGWGKLTHFQDTVSFFSSLHIPFPVLNAGLAAGTEFIGAVCLLLGLGLRFVPFPMAFTMVVAILTTKLQDLHSISDLVRFQEMDYLLIFVVLAIFGAGKYSLDCFIKSKLK